MPKKRSTTADLPKAIELSNQLIKSEKYFEASVELPPKLRLPIHDDKKAGLFFVIAWLHLPLGRYFSVEKN